MPGPSLGGRRSPPANRDDEDFVVATAAPRLTKLGKPFTRRSIRKLASPARSIARPIRIGREALRCLRPHPR